MIDKKATGRPFLPDEKRKKRLVTLRLTDAQYEVLNARAKELNISMARYIRRVLKI